MQDLWMGGALDPPLVYCLGWIGTDPHLSPHLPHNQIYITQDISPMHPIKTPSLSSTSMCLKSSVIFKAFISVSKRCTVVFLGPLPG